MHTWHRVMLTYPCPTCNAKVGDRCTTTGGRLASTPHAARWLHAGRCANCGLTLPASDEPDGPRLCDNCAEYARLLAERYHHPPRK